MQWGLAGGPAYPRRTRGRRVKECLTTRSNKADNISSQGFGMRLWASGAEAAGGRLAADFEVVYLGLQYRLNVWHRNP